MLEGHMLSLLHSTNQSKSQGQSRLKGGKADSIFWSAKYLEGWKEKLVVIITTPFSIKLSAPVSVI